MKALVIVGSTGVGKTSLSLEIATKYFQNCFEIISADSVQLYKYMDIGSGKLSVEERAGVPHHMIDVITPDFDMEAGIYCSMVDDICAGIIQRGKIPLFVGGTGLYIDSFFKGLSNIPEIDPSIREALEKEASTMGLDSLYSELSKVDPIAASRIHKNDKQRVLRALQVYRGTGKAFSSYKKEKKNKHESEDTLYVGLDLDRKELYERINLRVDQMISDGFLEEVKDLKDQGYHMGLKSMKSIGYFELFNYLESDVSLNRAISNIKYESRRYAKRQLTWFKRNKLINWFNLLEIKKIVDLIGEWIR